MSPKLSKKLPFWITNKYYLVTAFVFFWLLFFDRYDIVSQYRSYRELKKLEQERAYYLSEIEKNNNDLKHLQNNPVYLERFARENYLMKAPGEDVFIIIDKHMSNAN